MTQWHLATLPPSWAGFIFALASFLLSQGGYPSASLHTWIQPFPRGGGGGRTIFSSVSFIKSKKIFPRSLLQTSPQFHWSELYHMAMSKPIPEKGDGKTVTARDQSGPPRGWVACLFRSTWLSRQVWIPNTTYLLRVRAGSRIKWMLARQP